MDFAVLAFFIALFGVIVEMTSILFLDRRLGREHTWIEERGTFGDQLEEWLMRKPEGEDKMSNLEALTTTVGTVMAKSARFASMQEASVDSRIMNKYNAEVQEAVKMKMPLMYKFLFKAAEYLGFDLEEIMAKGELEEFISALQHNKVDVLLQGNQNSNTNNFRSKY